MNDKIKEKPALNAPVTFTATRCSIIQVYEHTWRVDYLSSQIYSLIFSCVSSDGEWGHTLIQDVPLLFIYDYKDQNIRFIFLKYI